MSDPGNLTTWVAIIAVATGLQTLLFLAAALGVYLGYRRITARIEAIQREFLAPLSTRAHAVIDNVEDMVGRVRRADDQVRDALHRTSERASRVAGRVLWPVIGLNRGVWAAITSFVAGERDERRKRAGEPTGRAGLAYEGGTHHVRS